MQFFFLFLISFLPFTLFAAETQIGAEFTKMLLEMDDTDWDTLGDENVPLEQQIAPVFKMLNKLQKMVPPVLLRQNIVCTFPSKTGLDLPALVNDPAQFRGKVFELKGNAVFVQELPLDPVQQQRYNTPAYYRCTVQVGQATAEVLVPFIPSGWKRNEPIQEYVSFTGIYIKRVEKDTITVNNPPAVLAPVLVSPKIEWLPNTFLGNLGFDVSSLEQVPPLKISDLKNKDLKLPPFLQLSERREILRRAFRFTEFDRDPFYGLLKALSVLPPGRLEQEARSENLTNPVSVSDLFNKPAETRGKPVLLHGTAKRVILTLVEDKEVQQLYGINKYYQIYLFTKESQGNPLVVCVRSLPEGMPTGAAADFSEEISVAAVPYKLWIYESSAALEEDKDGRKPNYAPLLIGRTPIWLPKPPPAGEQPSAWFYSSLVVMFAVWLSLRFYKTRRMNRNIEFKLKK